MSAGPRRRTCGVRSAECGIVLLLMLAGGMAAAPAAEASMVNRIIAVVNDDVITEGDVSSQLNALMDEHRVSPKDEREARSIRKAVLQRLIEHRLMLQEAKRLELSVSAEEVSERLRDVRRRLGSEEAYAQWLAEGQLNEEQLKRYLRDQLLIQRAIDREVRSKIVVTLSDVMRAAPEPAASGASAAEPTEEAEVSHLLIRVTDARGSAEAERLIRGLAERLRDGAAFAEVAKEYSEDPHAEDGGQMGWMQRGQLLPELDEAVFHLAVGELSVPIRTGLGYHLVKVTQRRRLAPEDAATRQDAIERQLYDERFEQAMREWLDRLMARAYIEVVAD